MAPSSQMTGSRGGVRLSLGTRASPAVRGTSKGQPNGYLYLIRDHYDREGAYYRQPQVWQWVCSAKLLGTLISALEPIIYTSIETTDERDVMKKRVDDWRIEASSSPL